MKLKAFNPDVKIKMFYKSRFLCNTPEEEARRIMEVFKDVFIGKPQGVTSEGVVGMYEVMP